MGKSQSDMKFLEKIKGIVSERDLKDSFMMAS